MTQPTDQDIGRALAEARQAILIPPAYGWGRPECMSVAAAAKRLGVNRVTLCNIEAGRRSVKVVELVPFAAALNTTVAKLLARISELAAERVTPAAASKKTGRAPSSAASKKTGRASRPPEASKKTGRAPSSAASKKTGRAARARRKKT